MTTTSPKRSASLVFLTGPEKALIAEALKVALDSNKLSGMSANVLFVSGSPEYGRYVARKRATRRRADRIASKVA